MALAFLAGWSGFGSELALRRHANLPPQNRRLDMKSTRISIPRCSDMACSRQRKAIFIFKNAFSSKGVQFVLIVSRLGLTEASVQGIVSIHTPFGGLYSRERKG